jgi:hypothetical protein
MAENPQKPLSNLDQRRSTPGRQQPYEESIIQSKLSKKEKEIQDLKDAQAEINHLQIRKQVLIGKSQFNATSLTQANRNQRVAKIRAKKKYLFKL